VVEQGSASGTSVMRGFAGDPNVAPMSATSIALVPSVIAELKEADPGHLQESLHPNHFGQQAVGTCLRQFWSQFGVKDSAPQSLACRNNGRATSMVLHEYSPTTAAVGLDAATVE
jgi:hypothetical protein